MPGKAKHGPKRSEQTAAPGQTVWMDPVGRCIYCGMTSDNLRDEHVFPRALGGNVIVPKASCLSCQKITSYIEGYCTRDRLFGAVRIQHRLPTRRPKERPTSLPIIETFYPSPELAPKVLIPIEDHPSVLILPVFEPPGVLLRRVPQIAGFFIANLTQDDRERTDRILAQGREGVKFYEEFKPGVFARLLAKIAHAAAAGRFGVDAFTHRLPKIILGEDGDAFDWAGGSTPRYPPQEFCRMNTV